MMPTIAIALAAELDATPAIRKAIVNSWLPTPPGNGVIAPATLAMPSVAAAARNGSSPPTVGMSRYNATASIPQAIMLNDNRPRKLAGLRMFATWRQTDNSVANSRGFGRPTHAHNTLMLCLIQPGTATTASNTPAASRQRSAGPVETDAKPQTQHREQQQGAKIQQSVTNQ